MKNKIASIACAIVIGFLSSCSPKQTVKEVNIIPAPVSLVQNKGYFTVNEKTQISIPAGHEEVKNIAGFLAQALNQILAVEVPIIEVDAEKGIIFKLDSSIDKQDAYQLSIDKNAIVLSAASAKGLFYGLQSLLQLLPLEKNNSFGIQALLIEDSSRFSYRGMHLDVGRHIFPVEFIKKYIDMLAMYKMNTFHWHLTEDQGWRIQIKKYPRLTEIASNRINKDGEAYGGFFTQEEIREVVKYASDRFITVIPEIEMPGHCLSTLAAYPELSCTGGPFEVSNSWGVFEDVYCAGNEKTFEFLEDVLLEVMDLFPSKYIHIGGDECPKARWEDCKKCKKRMRKEGLKDAHELQSWFIKRMEQFLVKHNRRLIGWDEILEGGLAPEATVMSWRGVDGGIAAAQQGHDAIMTPGTHCYFDHYQGDSEYEPVAIGGYTTLQKVYSYEPIPEELNAEEAKHILGAQGNVWTEYIPNSEKVEYMMMPRMMALAEVVWSPVENKNWNDFVKRFQAHESLLQKLNINYAKSVYNLELNSIFKEGKVILEFSSQLPGDIHYTLDGKEPTLASEVYEGNLEVYQSTVVKAALFTKGEKHGKTIQKDINCHKAYAKPISFEIPYTRPEEDGEYHLVNGLTGSENYRDGNYTAFQANDMIAVIDLEKETEISKITVGATHRELSWVFRPEFVAVYLSDDGKDFYEAGQMLAPIAADATGRLRMDYTIELDSKTARYLKVVAKNIGKCPDWHKGAGGKAWIFVDEIIVE
ncbi:MAG: family 20 glycosylhydrolase [Bacteroidales bacterium]|nr:family 20 glycosylhydrolase [Bacteroidales bacterium]